MRIHSGLVHRGAKITYERLKDIRSDLKVTLENVKQVLSRFARCKQYNPIRIEGFTYIEAFESGEKVAIDVIGPYNGNYIVTAIDYLSRFVMEKVFKNKTS
ncbi:hypothetical protein NGRA_2523 [Nosema granulosis]|uniref:Uncharacterized protein n=1 Tax=Nosema granulosis TaxID=83296 RepID=A0A9P6GWX0_9MICR|nr:hypothetical protein NGRA_2523 [Nosema granulosis]